MRRLLVLVPSSRSQSREATREQALSAIGQATAGLQELDADGSLRAELEDAAECVGLGGS